MSDTPAPPSAPPKDSTPRKETQRELIMRRREAVSKCHARGQSCRAIVESLVKLKITKPDGSAFDYTTISLDIKAIRASWREYLGAGHDVHVADFFAELDGVRSMAVAHENEDAWLRTLALRAKVLGLEAPIRQRAETWEDEVVELLRTGRITEAKVLEELGEAEGQRLIARARLGGAK